MVRVRISALSTILISKVSLEFCISVQHSIWICVTHVTYGFMKVHMTFFAAAISWNRFHFICKFITFDDKPTRNNRWKNDKYACMRELFKNMNVPNAKGLIPLPLLAIDETFYPYSGAIGCKQYSPNKSAKYGLLYHSLCDSSALYTYFTLPCAWKLEEIAGEAAKFYVTRTNEYAKYLVTEFNQYNSIQGCNISMDWYFTSVTLAEWRLQNNCTTLVPCIANELKAMTDRDEKLTLSVHCQDKEIMLVLDINKTKSGKKNIITLTTIHGKVKMTDDQ